MYSGVGLIDGRTAGMAHPGSLPVSGYADGASGFIESVKNPATKALGGLGRLRLPARSASTRCPH
jgi:hypothetical protein